MTAQECVDRFRIAPVPARECYVRHERPVLGFKTDSLHGPLDLRGERKDRFTGFRRCP